MPNVVSDRSGPHDSCLFPTSTDGAKLAWTVGDAGSSSAVTVEGRTPAPFSFGARVVDAELFRLLVEFEVPKAQRLRYPLSVVCLQAAFATGAARPSDSLASMVAQRIRGTDVAAAQGPEAVTLLLIDADVPALPGIIRRIVSDFEATRWATGAASYPKSANTAEALLEQAGRTSFQADEGNGLSRLGPRA